MESHSQTESLTERELEVLQLLDSDLSNAQIAEKLFVERSTVRFHIKNIYAKLGISNRQEAVERARKLNLLDEQEFKTRQNLPAQLTTFIGRSAEIQELTDLLRQSDHRLITILAPGGMGKTRLSVEVARGLLPQIEDGIFFVSLAPIESAESIVMAIADALEVRFPPDIEPRQHLLTFLSDQKLLLILDNFEHLLDGAPLISDILKFAPNVKTLITSRERLRLSGEKVYSISGMIFPDWETPEDALEYDAVKLFMQGAQLARSEFELEQDELMYLARICRLTEGMPLAIVLASAWVDVLSLQEIADEIQQSVDFLSAELRDLPRRQWSIRAVYEPTWNRLTEDEQVVFMRFAVFRGGCNREAAQAVTGANLRHLQTFVNKALLTRTSEGRYEIHELLRQYAEEQLNSTGLSDSLEVLYMQYYADFMAKREADLKTQRQIDALVEIRTDLENIRTMWNLAIHHVRFDLIDQAVECLLWFCFMDGRYENLEFLIQTALTGWREQLDDSSDNTVWYRLQARLLWAQRFRAGNYHDVDDAIHWINKCLESAKENQNEAEIAHCFLQLANATTQMQDYSRAMELYEQTYHHFQTLNDPYYSAWVLHFMKLCVEHSGGGEKCLPYIRDAIEIRRKISDIHGLAGGLYNLGTMLMVLGDIEGALIAFREIETIHDERTSWVFDFITGAVSYVYFLTGDFEKAQQMSMHGLEANKRAAYQLSQVLPFWTLGLLACVNGNYQKAVKIAEEILSIAPRPVHRFGGDWIMALARGGLDDHEGAIQANYSAIVYSLNGNVHGQITWCLPAAVMIEIQRGNKEWAVELLSLAFHHPKSATGWLEHWSLIAEIQEDLEAQLDTKTYQSAWQRGKMLDLEQVAKDLLASYSIEDQVSQ